VRLSASFAILLFCVGQLPLAYGQQVQPLVSQQPTVQPSQTDQPLGPLTTPDSGSTTATPVSPSAIIDPKTGEATTPVEQREKDIDKYDPMKQGPPRTTQNDDQTPDDQKKSTAKSKDQSKTANSSTQSSTGAAAGGGGAAGAATGDSSGDLALSDSESGYSGPAVLSRSYTLARPMVLTQNRWRASVGFSFLIYDGQGPVAVSNAAGYQSTTSEAGTLTWNFSGRHLWRHDQLGISYNGSYSQYSGQSLTGSNHSFNLDYAHVLSRRMSFQLVQSLQEYSQNYALQNPVLDPNASIANINLATSPSVVFLDSITRQTTSTASLTYRQSSRLSYNLSSSYFIIGRTQGVGNTGKQFGADANYRLTRKTTVGAYYSYTAYAFSHNIASSQSNSIGAIYSYVLDRNTQLQTRVGATRIESLQYETVPLSPALAAVLGQGSTIINAYAVGWTSDISAQLVRDLHRSRKATLAYAHGQSPGNGVQLTSIQQTISAGYAMNLFKRRIPLGVGVVVTSLQSTTNGVNGSYSNRSVYVNTSRTLGRGINGTLSFNYLSYDVGGVSQNSQVTNPQNSHTINISLGLSWGIPENWLRF
jgi:hypothetical protein